MCGIARSGSTAVWQVLRAVFGEGIEQIHPDTWIPDNRKVIVTMRHPYDIAASRYRIRLSRGGVGCGGWQGLEAELYVMKSHFDGVKKIMAHGNYYILHYEEFWNNRWMIYDMIEKELGRFVPREERELIEQCFGLEANRKRAAQLKDFNSHDKDMIHGDHIGKVTPNSWSKVLPKDLWFSMLRFCNPILEEWELWPV
jgi:hypothetical protein